MIVEPHLAGALAASAQLGALLAGFSGVSLALLCRAPLPPRATRLLRRRFALAMGLPGAHALLATGLLAGGSSAAFGLACWAVSGLLASWAVAALWRAQLDAFSGRR